MYIVSVDQSLWTSGTGSGEGVNPQDRKESDLIQRKDGETPLDGDEEGGIEQITKRGNRVDTRNLGTVR